MWRPWGHSPEQMHAVAGGTGVLTRPAAPTDVAALYRSHGDLVWRALARFGVREADLLDQSQEVWIVVHRQLRRFRGESSVETWLFGIARRVAAAYRRRAFFRREEASADPAGGEAAGGSPEEDLELRLARGRFARILDRMTLDQRAVFVMFEVEGSSGREIAELLGCPLQTVFSRLRRAREVYDREVQSLRERGGRP